MKEIVLNGINYEIIKDKKNGYDKEEVESKATEYFTTFDYIVGDWAYGKLRLKGFYDKNNKKCKEFNNIEFLEKYLKENCAYDCKYFILKKGVQK